jgi:hypothetical protein
MTEYRKKYLKYKKKYLESKINNKQTGGGQTVKTIPNNGALEGMSVQCFWISILDYLKRNGHPSLTLRELRNQGGLGTDTEQTMFDIDYLVGPELDRQPIFFNAAIRIAELYNLRIQIYTASRSSGDNIGITTPRASIGDGTNLVEIAQFGIGHFELIDANGSNFIPAVFIKGELTKNIDPVMKDIYYQLSENEGMLQILNSELTVNNYNYDKELKAKEDIKKSVYFTPSQKDIFITEQEQSLDKLVNNINVIEKKIKQLEEEISSFKLIISEFEGDIPSQIETKDRKEDRESEREQKERKQKEIYRKINEKVSQIIDRKVNEQEKAKENLKKITNEMLVAGKQDQKKKQLVRDAERNLVIAQDSLERELKSQHRQLKIQEEQLKKIRDKIGGYYSKYLKYKIKYLSLHNQ